MDLDGIIRDLLDEHRKLDSIIQTLENQSGPDPQPKRRGRKFMDSAGRREVSERMKQYWAKRRERQGAPEAPAPVPPDPDEQARAAAA